MIPRRKFWGSAVAAAAGYAALTLLLLPYRALGMTTLEERLGGWLLTLWTGGVMALLFGAAALLGVGQLLTVRDVEDAASVREAVERRKLALKEQGGGGRNFASWTVVTGALLLGIYFVAWLTLAG